MYPTYQVRLGRRRVLRYRQVGHGQKEDLSDEQIGTLCEPYDHYAFSKGLDDWIAKHNRYSTLEAKETLRYRAEGTFRVRELFSREPARRRNALRSLAHYLPARPTLRFLYMYVLRAGFLDGSAGLTYCRMLRLYETMIVLKVRHLRAGEGIPRDR
jgi:hypothetical protein